MNSKRVKKRKTIPRAARPVSASPVDSVIRAVDAFRRGKPVVVREAKTLRSAFAVETLDAASLRVLKRTSDTLRLVLTHARAQTLKIRLYTPKVVALDIRADMMVEDLRAIADPTDDLEFPMKGPFDALRAKLARAYPAAVVLAKLAGLLPAVVIADARGMSRGVEISVADIDAYDGEVARTLRLVTRARVPLDGAEIAELAAFRPSDGGPEHYAVIIGSPLPHDPVLVRLHSECFTGDLLGSLKCDCGSQLRGAVDAIAKAGSGIILYLAQEGRGIGLINKLRAYRLQDQGFDTIIANERLGFEAEERHYGIAARMLELLGFRTVRLMTNNPEKLRGLEEQGIKVLERVPHAFPDNPHNREYLRTKADKAGHLIS
jgi:GTP cyclohydrolase II